ncbi:MAG: hypothetical protein PVSMB7_03200 [Chloroflexota bacterium]
MHERKEYLVSLDQSQSYEGMDVNDLIVRILHQHELLAEQDKRIAELEKSISLLQDLLRSALEHIEEQDGHGAASVPSLIPFSLTKRRDVTE